jgi:hypothetical protein
MKTITFLFIFVSVFAFGQNKPVKDTVWHAGGNIILTVAQTSFTNWAAGGENSYSGTGRVGLFGNYKKSRTIWENNLDMAYGRASQSGSKLKKTDDFIELNSKLGYQTNNSKWFYTVVFNGKTQFSKGYQYSDVDTIPDFTTSEPFAPLYLNLALGVDFQPNKYLSLFISPLNSKNIYVNDIKYSQRYSIDSAKQFRSDLGALVKFKFDKEIVKNVKFLTKLDLFANYLALESIKDVDVNWEILISMKVYKMLSVNLNTQLIWDNDVKYVYENGTLGDARLQFKEIFGAGLAYKF